MMPGRTLAWGLIVAILAAVLGWVGGAKARDALSGRYDTAVGPVRAGVVVTPPPTEQPTPAATVAQTPSAVPTVTPAPTLTPAPTVTLPPTFPPTPTPLVSP
jgi:hypothetical protein